MIILTTLMLNTSQSDIIKAAGILRSGGLCAIPTETVYGLGANGLDPAAVSDIFKVKGRPQDNPLILHISNINMLLPLIIADEAISERVTKLASAFWPGPLTIIFPRSTAVPDAVTAGGNTVAIRMPSHPAALALIEAAGVPIAAPSANLSGRPSPTTAAQVYEDLNGLIPAVIDGGSCSIGVESTVLDITSGIPSVLRPGGVSRSEIEECLGIPVTDSSVIKKGVPVRSPGMKYRHYAPKKPLIAVLGTPEFSSRFILSRFADEKIGVICFRGSAELFERSGIPYIIYGDENDSDSCAKNLFTALRDSDNLDADMLYIQLSPDISGRGAAVYNRVYRACGGNIVKEENIK